MPAAGENLTDFFGKSRVFSQFDALKVIKITTEVTRGIMIHSRWVCSTSLLGNNIKINNYINYVFVM